DRLELLLRLLFGDFPGRDGLLKLHRDLLELHATLTFSDALLAVFDRKLTGFDGRAHLRRQLVALIPRDPRRRRACARYADIHHRERSDQSAYDPQTGANARRER